MCPNRATPVMRRPALFLFAKEPRPGTVKTRLCPPLDAEQAAACHRAFTADLLSRVAGLERVHTRIAAAPDGDAPWLDELARSAGVERVWQGEGDLGARMRRALETGCMTHGAAIVIGSDSPDLPLDAVAAAADAVGDGEAVIGPCPDGGYYLVGCTAPVPPIFELDAPWGGEDVLTETLARLAGAGCRHRVLPPWRDIDDVGDLSLLAARVATRARVREELPRTTEVMERLRTAGAAI